MVLPLLSLPVELQALFALLLVDSTTAGRLAQASHACKVLLRHRLEVLHEERLAAQARMQAMRQRKRAAVLELFEAVDDGPSYRCKAHSHTRLPLALHVGSSFVFHAAARSRCS